MLLPDSGSASRPGRREVREPSARGSELSAVFRSPGDRRAQSKLVGMPTC